MERFPLALPNLDVLVIGCSGSAADSLFNALDALGIWRVARKADAEEGFAYLPEAAHRFDVAILDIDNECTDSIDLIRRSAEKGVPAFILMTSHEEFNISLDAIARRYRVNILGILSKPVRCHQLASLLSRSGERSADIPNETEWKSEREWTEDELSKALDDRQFIPFFQPQIDLTTGRINAVEVLARWINPELGLLSASRFIDMMEQTELIDRLFDTLLLQSLEYASQWKRRGWHIGLAVNVSPSTLQNTDLPIHLSELVKCHGLSAGQIKLELTETTMLSESNGLLEAALRLRLLGFKLSADDFGSGYASLQQLSELPFTEIKIDKSLVTAISTSKKSAAIMESIVGLANKLDMCTVAEGIACKTDRDFLRSLGCRLGQAYYFAKPMGHADLVGHLQRARQGCSKSN